MGVFDFLPGVGADDEAEAGEEGTDAEGDADGDEDRTDRSPADFRDRAERLAARSDVPTLDFTLESLTRLDELAAGPPGHVGDELAYGSYLGETLVRNYDAEWTRTDGWQVAVTLPEDRTTLAVFDAAAMSIEDQPVFEKVANKLEAGGAARPATEAAGRRDAGTRTPSESDRADGEGSDEGGDVDDEFVRAGDAWTGEPAEQDGSERETEDEETADVDDETDEEESAGGVDAAADDDGATVDPQSPAATADAGDADGGTERVEPVADAEERARTSSEPEGAPPEPETDVSAGPESTEDSDGSRDGDATEVAAGAGAETDSPDETGEGTAGTEAPEDTGGNEPDDATADAAVDGETTAADDTDGDVPDVTATDDGGADDVGEVATDVEMGDDAGKGESDDEASAVDDTAVVGTPAPSAASDDVAESPATDRSDEDAGASEPDGVTDDGGERAPRDDATLPVFEAVDDGVETRNGESPPAAADAGPADGPATPESTDAGGTDAEPVGGTADGSEGNDGAEEATARSSDGVATTADASTPGATEADESGVSTADEAAVDAGDGADQNDDADETEEPVSRNRLRVRANEFAMGLSAHNMNFAPASLAKLDRSVEEELRGSFGDGGGDDGEESADDARGSDADATEVAGEENGPTTVDELAGTDERELVRNLGAYYGEVLARALDGEWDRSATGDFAVAFPDRDGVDPAAVDDVARDVLAGRSAFVHHYDAVARRVDRDEEPISDGRGGVADLVHGVDRGASPSAAIPQILDAADGFAADWPDRDLDYSPASLGRVDDLVDATLGVDADPDATVGDPADPASLFLTAQATGVGAYFATVLVRALDAKWQIDGGVSLYVAGPEEGATADPFAIAADAVRGEESLAEAYEVLRTQLAIDAPPAT